MIREQRIRVEHPVIVAIGSNLGDREATIRAAVREIAALPGIAVTAASGLIETPALKPAGVDADAPAYLNAAIAVRTALSPRELLTALGAVEKAHGRTREQRWGDRTLDLDIVAFGALAVTEPDLVIPHPRAWRRAFVLAPWLELEPNANIVGRGPIADLLAAVLATHDKPVPYPAGPLV